MTEEQIKTFEEKYKDTHTIERVSTSLECDLTKLKDNQSVVFGDGKTFYFLLTEK